MFEKCFTQGPAQKELSIIRIKIFNTRTNTGYVSMKIKYCVYSVKKTSFKKFNFNSFHLPFFLN